MGRKTKKGSICKYCIVKRKGHAEEFDERKVYASCYAACLSSHIHHLKAEKICEKVSKEVKAWATKRKFATSDLIFEKVISAMKKQDNDAAFMYETHRDIG
jgi:transcriptional regulator NrdR family protein